MATVTTTRSIDHPTHPGVGRLRRMQRSWAAHRADLAAARRLEQELAGYDTPAARQELDAILARADQDAMAPIIAIVDRQRAGLR